MLGFYGAFVDNNYDKHQVYSKTAEVSAKRPVFRGHFLIIFRYLIGEVAKSQLAVFLILMTIIMSQRFVRILADASEGDLPAQLILTMVGLKLPQLALIILPLSAFLGIFIALGRIYADSEMTVLHATGFSERRVATFVLSWSLLLAVAAAWVSMVFSPWSMEREYEVLERVDSDVGLYSLVPGRFQQSSNERAVLFVHDIARGSGELSRVFVAQSEIRDGKPFHSIVYAQSGAVQEDPSGAQMLVLEQGRRYAGQLQSPPFEVLEFGRYQLQIREQEVEHRRRKLSSLPTPELLQQLDDPEAVAEWHWRIAIPLSIVLLALIAVPLSRVNPRQGKFGKLLPALGLYLGYYMLLIVTRSALENDQVPGWLGMWWIHASALALGLLLLAQQLPSVRRLQRRLREAGV